MNEHEDLGRGLPAEDSRERSFGPVVFNLKHGGHILDAKSDETRAIARLQEGMTLAPAAGAIEFSTPFDYLFPALATDPRHLLPADQPQEVVTQLKALADAMLDDALVNGSDLQPSNNSTIPPIYTYWGQFIDHDLTANTDRDTPAFDITKADFKPLSPDCVTKHLRNLRQPTLNLDSVLAFRAGGVPKREASTADPNFASAPPRPGTTRFRSPECEFRPRRISSAISPGSARSSMPA